MQQQTVHMILLPASTGCCQIPKSTGKKGQPPKHFVLTPQGKRHLRTTPPPAHRAAQGTRSSPAVPLPTRKPRSLPEVCPRCFPFYQRKPVGFDYTVEMQNVVRSYRRFWSQTSSIVRQVARNSTTCSSKPHGFA